MFERFIVERKTSKMVLEKDSRKEKLKKYVAKKGPHTRTQQVRDVTTPPPKVLRNDRPPARDAESPERTRLIPIDFANVPASFKRHGAMDQVAQMRNSEMLALALDGKKPELQHYECVNALAGVRPRKLIQY